MTRPRPLKLDFPSLRFAGHSPPRPRGEFNPWADEMNGGLLPVGWRPLPDEFTIEEIQRSVQHPWEVPGGYHGRAALIANLGGFYAREAGGIGAGVEDCHPRVGTICLERILLQSGQWPRFIDDIGPPLYGPITLIKAAGDRLFTVSEDNGVAIAGGAELFFSALIAPQPAIGFDRLDRLEAGIIHTMPLSGSAADGAPSFYRSLIPVPADATPGTHLSVYVAAREHGLALNSLGVGVQAGSGPAMTATPIVMVNGAPGLTLPAARGCWVGPVPAPAGMVPGCKLIFEIGLSPSAPWAFKMIGEHPSWYYEGGVWKEQPKRTHVVYAVKWWNA